MLVAVSLVGVSAGAANAAVVTLTFMGTVTSGFDGFNEFNTGSSDLTGQSFVQTLTLDTADLNVVWQTPYSYAAGFDNKPIHASGSATINGHTFSWESDIAVAHLALSTQVVHGGGDEFQMGADVNISPGEHIQSAMYLNSSMVSFVGNADPGKSHSFDGSLSAFAPMGFFSNSSNGQYTYFIGDLSGVRYQVSAVPEPTQFAMFGIGLGMVALLRRRRSTNPDRRA
ncbi:hypothetical protein FHW58_004970 [Duganella sp. 1224]|uniref:PEP-CTERM sorting domain-containing protein n=1 Tax=Duganella sp. 1224 TaxID=2587052 RepID=UPI0015C93786|nr:PEP-CTERM sorting domain-containing protein [Duganella sp. 1224]NYE63739.1 hypothetical protein [Duganella sp. 1224]